MGRKFPDLGGKLSIQLYSIIVKCVVTTNVNIRVGRFAYTGGDCGCNGMRPKACCFAQIVSDVQCCKNMPSENMLQVPYMLWQWRLSHSVGEFVI